MAQSTQGLSVGMVLFPNFTLLDLAGPYDVFSRLPATHVYLVAARLELICAEQGGTMMPDTTFESAPAFDVLCVPGGPGQQLVMEDERFLSFLREQGQAARLITSVCTGALLLGAAGLLQGYRATTHWRYLDLLSLLGAQPVAERVVIDGNRITGAGATSGIDLALEVASVLFGEEIAQPFNLASNTIPTLLSREDLPKVLIPASSKAFRQLSTSCMRNGVSRSSGLSRTKAEFPLLHQRVLRAL